MVDGVTDPHNLGAVLRSAECAGATGAVVPRHRAVHLTPAATKAAAGAIEHLPIAVVPGVPSALRRLTALGVWTMGLADDARRSLYESNLGEEPVALVLGSEGHGLSVLARKRCDELVAIPHHGALPALNVSTAAAVACFEVARRRRSLAETGASSASRSGAPSPSEMRGRRAQPAASRGEGAHRVDRTGGVTVDEDAEVVVVGMGPGGEDVAGRLAEAGLDVVGIDGGLVGGECPYWGCIPSKMMIRAADLLAEVRRTPRLAGSATVDPEWQLVARRIRDEATDSWDDTAAVERFEGKGGRFVRGWGRLAGGNRVSVGERSFRAGRAIVINTGAKPSIPPVPGLDSTPYWTNREAIETEEVPPRLAVLGGGAIGVELAQVFARFGSHVTVVEAAPRLVALEEPEAGALVAEVFAVEGIDVCTGAAVRSVGHDGTTFTVTTAEGEPVVADRLLVATGRHPDLAALHVSAIGLDEGGAGRCPWTTTCGWRVRRRSGPSATSRATASSPMSRCTRPTSS